MPAAAAASGTAGPMQASQTSASAMRSTCNDGGSARSIVVPMRSATSGSSAPRAQRNGIACVVEVGLESAQPVVDADATGEVLRRRRRRTSPPPRARDGAAVPASSPAVVQALQRVGARRLEQPVARLAGIARWQHRHQRAVHQRVERVEHGPDVEAPSSASTSTCWMNSSDALPAMTPRRRNTCCSRACSRPWLHSTAERSVCWRAGAARLRLAVSSSRRSCIEASRRGMPSIGARAAASSIANGKPSSARQASITAGVVASRQRESLVHRLRAFGEQGHGAELQRLLRRHRTLRHGERRDAQDPLGREPQRRLAGDQQPQPGRRFVQRLAQLRDVRRAGARRCPAPAASSTAPRRRSARPAARRARRRRRARPRSPRATRLASATCVSSTQHTPCGYVCATRGEQVLREQGLADAAGADDADQSVPVDQRAERVELVGAPEQRGQLGGQVGAQRAALRPRRRSSASARAAGPGSRRAPLDSIGATKR